MKSAERVYVYRGLIERGPRYQWRPGYSETTTKGHVTYPWLTKTECRAEAKRDGLKAVFTDEVGKRVT
jgi:hypothetical protein